jgi:hypothetical protein
MLPEADPVVAPELAPELAPEVASPAPGMAPTPGDPDVAVPGDMEPEGRFALLEASGLDWDEGMLDEDEPASPDVAPCAWTSRPMPNAAADTRIRVMREENSGFMMFSDRQVVRARLITCCQWSQVATE